MCMAKSVTRSLLTTTELAIYHKYYNEYQPLTRDSIEQLLGKVEV